MQVSKDFAGATHQGQEDEDYKCKGNQDTGQRENAGQPTPVYCPEQDEEITKAHWIPPCQFLRNATTERRVAKPGNGAGNDEYPKHNKSNVLQDRRLEA